MLVSRTINIYCACSIHSILLFQYNRFDGTPLPGLLGLVVGLPRQRARRGSWGGLRVKGRNPGMARPAAAGEDTGRDGEGAARPLMLKPWGAAPPSSWQGRGEGSRRRTSPGDAKRRAMLLFFGSWPWCWQPALSTVPVPMAPPIDNRPLAMRRLAGRLSTGPARG